MHRLNLLLANPAWRHVGPTEHGVVTTGECGGSVRQISEIEDGIAIKFGFEGTTLQRLELFRSITTSDQLYVHVSDQAVTVSDHFGWMVNSVPVGDRRLDPAALIDHFLFRTTPGESSYLSGVHRVGNGSLWSWTAETGGTTRVVDRLARQEYVGSRAAKDLLAVQLDHAIDAVPSNGRNLLSGGVDSTLLQSFAPGLRTVSATIDAPEFALERDYAAGAARLFGVEHEFVHVQESEYAAHLSDVISRTGLPPHHLQTVLVDAAAAAADATFVTAQFADALFGLDSAFREWRIRRYGMQRLKPLLSMLEAIPWARARRFGRNTVRDIRQLQTELDDPRGFAMQFAVYSDIDVVRELFGSDAVDERLSRRLAYVRDRVDAVDEHAPRAVQQVELGHWIDFFCDDTIAIWRQCAHSHDNRLIAPFSGRAVVETAMRIDPAARFCSSGRTKPALKDLLVERVPTYPIDQPKGGSGLPVNRYLRSGPLREVAERALSAGWPVPLDARGLHTDWILWNLVTLDLWKQTVLERPGYALPATSRIDVA